MKRNGDVSLCGVCSICEGLRENEKAKGVAVLLNYMWRSYAVEFEYVSPRRVLVQWMSAKVKVYFVVM